MLAVPDRPTSLADAVRALSTLPLATTKTEQPDQGRDRGVSDTKGPRMGTVSSSPSIQVRHAHSY